MEEINCDKPQAFRNQLDAESCVRFLEQKTGKPHRVQASGMVYESVDINWWYAVDFYDCHDGAIFTSHMDVSTRELANQCARSLNRIETGEKTYKAVLHKKTGWFQSNHYMVMGE